MEGTRAARVLEHLQEEILFAVVALESGQQPPPYPMA
jgi:hypothetical protein